VVPSVERQNAATGVDTSSSISFKELMDETRLNDVTVYTIGLGVGGMSDGHAHLDKALTCVQRPLRPGTCGQRKGVDHIPTGSTAAESRMIR